MARFVRRKIICKHAMIFILNKREGARANALFCSLSYKCNFCMVTPMHKNRSIRLTEQTHQNFKACKICKIGYSFKHYIHFNWNKAKRKKIFRFDGRVAILFFSIVYYLLIVHIFFLLQISKTPISSQETWNKIIYCVTLKIKLIASKSSHLLKYIVIKTMIKVLAPYWGHTDSLQPYQISYFRIWLPIITFYN